MDRDWRPLAVCLVIAGLGVVRVASVWEGLPPIMSSHYGLSGRPDAFMARASLMWLFGGIGLTTVLLLASAPLWLHRIPAGALNVPNRDYWMAPERRARAYAAVARWMAWFAVPTMLLLLGVLDLVLRANLARGGLATRPFLAMLGGYVGVTVVMLVALFRSFRVPASPR